MCKKSKEHKPTAIKNICQIIFSAGKQLILFCPNRILRDKKIHMNFVAPYSLIAKYKGVEGELIENNTGEEENKTANQKWRRILTDARTYFEQVTSI
jgi:hypothetical protein